MTTFTEAEKTEAFDNIVRLISQGMSVKNSIKHLRDNKEPACGTEAFFRWLSESSEMANQYMRARENRADARFEKLDEIIEEVKLGTLETDKARIVIDTMKWQMGKERGTVYGAKADITSKGQSIAPKDATSILLRKFSQAELEDVLAEAESE